MFFPSTSTPLPAYYNSSSIPSDGRKLQWAKEVRQTYDQLMENYGDLLDIELRIHAWGLMLMYSVPKFVEAFRYQVLYQAYSIFDQKGNIVKEDEKYKQLKKRIGIYNPEWLQGFIKNHDNWLNMIIERRKTPIRPSQ